MRQQALYIILGACLCALVGAIAGFTLGESTSEVTLAGAVMGIGLGAYLGAQIHAHREAVAAARRKPDEAVRQSRLANARVDATAEFAEHHHRAAASNPGTMPQTFGDN